MAKKKSKKVSVARREAAAKKKAALASGLLNDSAPGAMVYQEVRAMVDAGWIKFPDEFQSEVEGNIQPNGLDAPIDTTAYIVPSNFHPLPGQKVVDAVKALPPWDCQQITIENFGRYGGTPLRRDIAYLIKGKGEFTLPAGFHVRASPKSSTGRRHDLARLITDYNASFDYFEGDGKKHTIWFLVQPQAYDHVTVPGKSYMQLRFFCHRPKILNDDELSQEVYAHNIVVDRDNKPLSAEERERWINDGLEMAVDLKGEDTEGLIGFKARGCGIPLDIGRKDYGIAELLHYYEPIFADPGANDYGTLSVHPNDQWVRRD